MIKKSSPLSPCLMMTSPSGKVTGWRLSAIVISSQLSRLLRMDTRLSSASYIVLFLMVEPMRILL